MKVTTGNEVADELVRKGATIYPSPALNFSVVYHRDSKEKSCGLLEHNGGNHNGIQFLV